MPFALCGVGVWLRGASAAFFPGPHRSAVVPGWAYTRPHGEHGRGRLRDIEYKLYIDMGTSELKTIVNMCIKLQGDNEEEFSIQNNKPNVLLDGCKVKQRLQTEEGDRGGEGAGGGEARAGERFQICGGGGCAGGVLSGVGRSEVRFVRGWNVLR